MKRINTTSLENESDTYRDTVRQTLLGILNHENSLSRCCAVRAMIRFDIADDATAQQNLINLLEDPDPDVRMEAAYTLGKLKITSAVDALVKNLEDDPEGDVRIQSVIALGEIASASTLKPLIRCLEQDGYPHLDHVIDEMEFSPSWEVQSQALRALGKLGDPRSIAPIIKLLENDEYDHLQEQGFQVLAQIDSEQTLTFLLQQLKQAGRLARRRAAQALSHATIFDNPDLARDQSQLQTLPPVLTMEILTALSQSLGDSDPGVRLYVARALGQTQNPLVCAPLILLLNDPDPDVRHEIAKLLGRMQGSEVVDRLHTLLGDTVHNKDKASIVHVLGEISDLSSVKKLTALLDTNDSDLLYEVMWALGECGSPAPKLQLATILANEKTDPTVRIQAAQSLGKLLNSKAPTELDPHQENVTDNDAVQDEPPQCSPWDVLTKAIYDRHVGVGYAALAALVDIDPAAAQQMLIGLLSTAPPTTAEMTDKQDAETVTAMTYEELKEQNPELIRQFNLDVAAENSTLTAILDASSSEQVETDKTPDSKQTVSGKHIDPALADSKPTPHERVRVLAARLLGNNQEAGDQDEIISTLIRCTQHAVTELKCEALKALGRIKAQRALPVIQQALQSEKRDIKLAALEALGQFDGAVLKDIELAHLHTDSDADVRLATVQILLTVDLPQTREQIYQALQDEDIEVCRTVLKALTYNIQNSGYTDRVTDLMFGFSGELRFAAATTLRRVGDFGPTARLLKTLDSPKLEEYHWICIDALAEMYTEQPTHSNNSGTSYAA